MAFEFLISALVTLLVVVDPVGLVPTFLGVTDGVSQKFRREIALRACLIAGGILIGTALFGDWLLRGLGISLPAFRIAGGLLLFLVAVEMVLGLRLKHATQDAEQAAEEHLHNMAAFPLAIPLMAGARRAIRDRRCAHRIRALARRLVDTQAHPDPRKLAEKLHIASYPRGRMR
jgi:multiple antibiotic resistance protein